MKLTPVLIVEAVEKSLPFWVDRMGFTKTVEVPEEDRIGFAILERAGAELMLQSIASVRKDVAAFAPDGDGTKGWRTQAPFDGILVAAAPLTIPEALTAQLAVGGRLIVPVGPEGEQQLVRLTRREQGIERRVLGAVSFVPLLGGLG